MSQERTNTAVQKVPFMEKIAYGLGDAGCNFIWTIVGMFLTIYYTDKVGIPAAVVGTIMLLTRLLDGVILLTIHIPDGERPVPGSDLWRPSWGLA